MSILIKGMEMPKDRSRWVVIYPDGKVEYSDKTDEWETLDKGAVPVPPHGRLIDADAMVNVQVYNDEFEDFQTVNMSIDDLLDSSWIELEDDSTIIPAEEVKES